MHKAPCLFRHWSYWILWRGQFFCHKLLNRVQAAVFSFENISLLWFRLFIARYFFKFSEILRRSLVARLRSWRCKIYWWLNRTIKQFLRLWVSRKLRNLFIRVRHVISAASQLFNILITFNKVFMKYHSRSIRDALFPLNFLSLTIFLFFSWATNTRCWSSSLNAFIDWNRFWRSSSHRCISLCIILKLLKLMNL